MTNTNHIGILCGYPFPEGMAATNRILAYSKGLNESGIEIDIFIFCLDRNKFSPEKLQEQLCFRAGIVCSADSDILCAQSSQHDLAV